MINTLKRVRVPIPKLLVKDGVIVMILMLLLAAICGYVISALEALGFDRTILLPFQIGGYLARALFLILFVLLFYKIVIKSIGFAASMLHFEDQNLMHQDPQIGEVVTEAQLVTEALKRIATASTVTIDALQDVREQVSTLAKLVLGVSAKAAKTEMEAAVLSKIMDALADDNIDLVRQAAWGLDDHDIRKLLTYTGNEPAHWRAVAATIGGYATLLTRFMYGLADLRAQLLVEVNEAKNYAARLEVMTVELKAKPLLVGIAADLYQVHSAVKEFKQVAPMAGVSTSFAEELPSKTIYFLEADLHDN